MLVGPSINTSSTRNLGCLDGVWPAPLAHVKLTACASVVSGTTRSRRTRRRTGVGCSRLRDLVIAVTAFGESVRCTRARSWLPDTRSRYAFRCGHLGRVPGTRIGAGSRTHAADHR